jgi:hypothetical protein
VNAPARALAAVLVWLPALGTAPAHVPIFADVGGKVYDPGPAIVQRYINYARGPLERRGDVTVCPRGTCLPLYYVDSHNIYCGSGTIDWFRAAADHPSWWLHASGNDEVLSAVTRYGSCPSLTPGSANTYFANYGDAGNQAYWRSYLAAKARAARPNQCFFLDDLAYRLARPSREITTLDTMLRFEGAELDALWPYCIWTNGLGPGGGRYANALRGAVSIDAYSRYARAGNVKGVTFEDPLWSAYDRTLRTANLPVVLNTVSRLLTQTRLQVAILDSSADVDGTSLDRVRRLHTAALWLVTGGALDRLVSWLDPHTNPRNGRLTGVYPEQTVVPTNPLRPMGPWAPARTSQGSGCRDDQTMPDGSSGGMADLLLTCGFDHGTPAGAYAREYGTCYAGGHAIGGCAAILNLEDVAVRVDRRRLGNIYRYAIGWKGGPLRGVCPADAGCDGALNLRARRLGNVIEIPAQDALLLAE